MFQGFRPQRISSATSERVLNLKYRYSFSVSFSCFINCFYQVRINNDWTCITIAKVIFFGKTGKYTYMWFLRQMLKVVSLYQIILAGLHWLSFKFRHSFEIVEKIFERRFCAKLKRWFQKQFSQLYIAIFHIRITHRLQNN